MSNIVSIEVNGSIYEGWQAFSMKRSIKDAASSFSLEVTEEFGAFGEGFVLSAGDECLIAIDDEPVLTGYIDSYSTSIDESDHTVSVSGRSRTADLIDCSAMNEPANFFNQSLLQIAKALVSPFGLEVIAGERVEFPVIEKFELNQGESPYQAIERLARKNQTLVTDDIDGNLVLTNASSDRYSVDLELYKSAEVTRDYSDRFSIYLTKAQQHGADFQDPLLASQVSAQVTDQEITRFRPKIIRAEGSATPAEALRRCTHERNRNIVESINLSIEVQGFTNSAGDLWMPNRLMWIVDEVLGIEHEFLLHTVEYNQSEAGTTCNLEFSLSSGFDLPATTEEIGTF